MVQLTVNLSPPLTGVQSKLHLIVGDAVYPVIDLPPSVNGLISMGISVSSPELDYAVILPEQTVEGVAYLETMSTLFNLLSDVTLSMTLTPVTEPEPPTPPIPPVESLLPAVASAIAGTLAVIWGISTG
ncbi:hypothetical protein LCGC14_1151290 [marine sediment metagenome]|uniref:Uncharacterized protein n=1 Tax=marine sediment metagenome TaxID=412755 RepID=A0A0F9M0B2_9ZZZZ